MKLTTKALATTVVLGLALTLGGCTGTSSNPGGGTSQGEQSTKKGTAKEASEMVTAYYASLEKESGKAKEANQKAVDTMKRVLGDKKYEEFATATNPEDAFKTFTPEESKKIADEIQKSNPLSDQIDFNNVSDSDRIYLNLIVLLTSQMMGLSGSESDKVEVTVPEDKVKTDGKTATIDFKDVNMTYDGKKQDTSGASIGMKTIDLSYVDGKWKINGEKMMKVLKEQSLTASNG